MILVKIVLLEIVQFLLEKEHIPVFCTECCYSVRHKNMETMLYFVAVCKANLSGTGIWQEKERNEFDFPGQINTGVVCVCACNETAWRRVN